MKRGTGYNSELLGSIPSGGFAEPDRTFKLKIAESAKKNGIIHLLAEASSNGFVFWRDTIEILGSAVSVEAITSPSIKLYPIPAYNQLTIDTKTIEHYNIDITSLNGQLILSKEVEGTTHQIDLSSLQKGVYFITIRSMDFVTTRKIMKL